MEKVLKTACLSGILLLIACSTSSASKPTSTTSPYDNSGSIQPVERDVPKGESASLNPNKVDTSKLLATMDKNEEIKAETASKYRVKKKAKAKQKNKAKKTSKRRGNKKN